PQQGVAYVTGRADETIFNVLTGVLNRLQRLDTSSVSTLGLTHFSVVQHREEAILDFRFKATTPANHGQDSAKAFAAMVTVLQELEVDSVAPPPRRNLPRLRVLVDRADPSVRPLRCPYCKANRGARGAHTLKHHIETCTSVQGPYAACHLCLDGHNVALCPKLELTLAAAQAIIEGWPQSRAAGSLPERTAEETADNTSVNGAWLTPRRGRRHRNGAPIPDIQSTVRPEEMDSDAGEGTSWRPDPPLPPVRAATAGQAADGPATPRPSTTTSSDTRATHHPPPPRPLSPLNQDLAHPAPPPLSLPGAPGAPLHPPIHDGATI
ncbi:MAG: hypothetical protein Q8R28_19490, partial [Dehalococcoidia bacterium]|nr:hypothetical protein [Dehalococcoidia bacterium]